jgi:hypothetical protein
VKNWSLQVVTFSAVLTDNKFDPTKFEQIGPAYFSATNALYLLTSNVSLLPPEVTALAHLATKVELGFYHHAHRLMVLAASQAFRAVP